MRYPDLHCVLGVSCKLALSKTQVPNEESLRSLATKLDEMAPKIPYHLWIEQP
jgi:hypothetical protein